MNNNIVNQFSGVKNYSRFPSENRLVLTGKSIRKLTY
jgi:hypothetical protein